MQEKIGQIRENIRCQFRFEHEDLMDSIPRIGVKINNNKMIGKYQINGTGYLRWFFMAKYQIYIQVVLDVQKDPLLNTKEADVAYDKT